MLVQTQCDAFVRCSFGLRAREECVFPQEPLRELKRRGMQWDRANGRRGRKRQEPAIQYQHGKMVERVIERAGAGR